MSDVICTLNKKQLIFHNFPLDNQRKFMKTKIFLNGNNNLKYEFNNADLIIDFSLDDEIFIGKEVKKIISFVESTFDVQLQMEQSTLDYIEKTVSKESNFINDYEKLRTLKSTDYLDTEEFNEYKKFCNETLVCTLRPYQYSASYFLTIGQGGFDFSVPGSGKTIISYSAYNYLRHKKICEYILIIGPINSCLAWNDEYETCFGVKPNFVSLVNMSKEDASIYLLSSSKNHQEITFINIDKAWRLRNEIISFMENKNLLLIVDEAHKEKNPDAEITKAILEITKKAKYRIILTGTPMPNGYEDLYSLMKIYEPYEKILPFNYVELRRLTKNGATPNQINRIMESLKPLYSRVSKAYLLKTGELLEPKYDFIKCEMSKEQQIIYDFLNQIAFNIDDFEYTFNQSLMKAVLIRKMQISANPRLLSKGIISSIEEYKKAYYLEFEEDNSDSEALIKADNYIKNSIANSPIANIIHKFEANYYKVPKNEAAVNLALKLVEQGENVILWEVFVQNMNTLYDLIKAKTNLKVEIINGTILGEERQNAINRFKSFQSKIMIANPATLAESISLHRCCQNAIYVNRNFNAAQFIQSKDRIHRINMPKGKTAHYYFLINENTVDESVDERLRQKEKRMLQILDSDELEISGFDFDNNSFMSLEDVLASFRK